MNSEHVETRNRIINGTQLKFWEWSSRINYCKAIYCKEPEMPASCNFIYHTGCDVHLFLIQMCFLTQAAKFFWRCRTGSHHRFIASDQCTVLNSRQAMNEMREIVCVMCMFDKIIRLFLTNCIKRVYFCIIHGK